MMMVVMMMRMVAPLFAKINRPQKDQQRNCCSRRGNDHHLAQQCAHAVR
jgi:hypothetical protein